MEQLTWQVNMVVSAHVVIHGIEKGAMQGSVCACMAPG